MAGKAALELAIAIAKKARKIDEAYEEKEK